MNYKPDEALLIAYLYDELQGEEKREVEAYLSANPQVRKELEDLLWVRKAMATVGDKEVIAPPIVLESSDQRFIWNAPYLKTVLGIAASLLILILAGWMTGLQFNFANQELRIGFGDPEIETPITQPMLTANQVQDMINTSLQKNNGVMEASWQETQIRIDESIRKNLAAHSIKNGDELIRQAALATEEQVRQYVLTMQAENAKMVNDYMTLSANEQSRYIEELLVDFGKYMEQQRKNDFQAIQTRLSSIEQNTDLFKQETEQILSSIITSVEGTNSNSIKN